MNTGLLWDDTILEKKCTQSSTTEEVHDIYMYDVNTGSENLIVPNVFYGFSSAYPFTLAFDGRRVVYVKANPTNSFMPLTNLYVTTFNTAPETTLTTDPEIPNDDGWFGQKPPTIALTCDTSGTTTFYQWDSNSDLGWAAYQGTITTPEGEHKLYYYSVDTLGNTESVQGHNFKVDLTPPTTTVTSNPVPGQNIGGWLTVIPQISLSTEDGADSYYQWDSTVGAWSNYTDTIPGQLGEHVLYYYSEDSHGNAEPVQSRPFKVAEADAIPPITTISIEEPPTDGSGYIEGTAVILTVNEPAVTYYQWDVPPSGDIPSQVNIPVMGGSGCFLPANNGTTVYWGKFLVPEGRHTLYYYSVDPSGNVETAQSNLFEQGILTPTLSIFALDQTRPVGADNPPFTVTTVGLVGADTLDSLNLGYSLSTTATADSPAGTYPITFSGGLTSTETYDPIIYLDGTLTIVESTSQPPIVDAGGDAALEGNDFSRAGSFSDDDSNTWTATVDYGDGTGRQDLVLTGTTFNLSHTYADKGVFTVNVAIIDDGNAVGSATFSVTINNFNAGPSISTAVLPEGTVGESYQSSALTASGGITPYSWSATGLPAGLTISSSGTISGIPVSPGTSEVVIKVIDSSGKSASAIFTLTIVKISEGGDSDSPTTDAQLSPEPNIAGWNNGSVSVKLEAIDNEGGSGVKTTEYKVGDSSSWTTYTEPFSVTAEGITIVGYRSIDNAGNTEEAKQITINIDTIAPDLTVISPDLMSPLSAGTNTFSFEATDSGSGLKETGALLEDAYGNKTDIENGSSQNLAFGTYTLKVTAVDNAGNGINKENLLVIYDTTGAVTAGGWIDSPSGAYAADPSVTGKANFGIDIKCKKGSNIPEGQTEFQLKDVDINFHSTGYQWFGISGNKAIYKGTGTINNQGDYGFMIWLKDEKDHADKKGMIRIRIWEKGNESFFIYDTQPGDPFDADPTTVLSGGSIVIH
ncbi:MAG TPA: MBG domain-containing protein [Syntrophomonadaceae bacterium]|nr:MBG domain-containing protein [Syntrophomonadaceae bacterium]